MLPVEIFNLLLGESSQFGVDIALITPLVVVDLPEVESEAENEDRGGGGQIETIADRVVRTVERQDYEAASISKIAHAMILQSD